MKALEGVGDASLGQWEERGRLAYHIRRRLTAEEETLVGPVIDIRGTPEAADRARLVRRYLPAGFSEPGAL